MSLPFLPFPSATCHQLPVCITYIVYSVACNAQIIQCLKVLENVYFDSVTMVTRQCVVIWPVLSQLL